MKKALLFLFIFSLFAKVYGSGQFSIGGGILDPSNPKGLYQLEYRWAGFFKYFRPQVGALTEEFHSFYVYAGLGVEFFITSWLMFTPSFSPGVYFHGSGVDLGYPLEFRSCGEFALQFRNCWRFGGQFYHLSNASLSNRNPGINAIALFLGVPF